MSCCEGQLSLILKWETVYAESVSFELSEMTD